MSAAQRWDDRRVMLASHVSDRYGEEIKPCPFCGSNNIALYMGPSPHMTCGGCGADGPAFDGSRDDIEYRQHKAIKAWNGSFPRQPTWKPGSI